jgi:hypothetical protein
MELLANAWLIVAWVFIGYAVIVGLKATKGGKQWK